MPQLHLLRHAKSDWAAVGASDRDRHLAARGVRAAEAMREHFAATGVSPDVVYCSPATRTRETLDVVMAALGDPRVDFDASLYEGGADTVLDLLRTEAGGASSVMVVGHNPTMAQLALWLSATDAGSARMRVRAEEKFPTGTLARLTFTGAWKDLGPGAARLVEFTTPHDLGAHR